MPSVGFAVKLTEFLFFSCMDGAESPSEGCGGTVIAGPGLAMSSLMAIIAAILLLICESYTVNCQIRELIQLWQSNVLLFSFCKQKFQTFC